jgi:2-keto-4-pentenoate hydratase/2-oxohepta-3-ene-1,7-dioic acid hydratase in catechol pathway
MPRSSKRRRLPIHADANNETAQSANTLTLVLYRRLGGYTCFNDGSVRDWQYHSSHVTSGKNFWQTGGLGPWLVTADEIPDPGCLDIKLLLNGKTLQDSNTRHLIFGVAQIIAYASALIPLKPGDVIATGTPSGVGFSRTPPIFMKAGDICEVQIEKIGTLRKKVEKAVG